MINASQLRLRNLIHDGERNVLTVRSITESKISVEENELRYAPPFIFGIPLTFSNLIGQDDFRPNDFPGFPDFQHLQRADIFLRFSKSPDVDYISIFKHVQIELKPGEKTPVNLFIKRIRFIHELQNAFFLLSGKELSLNKVDFEIF